MSALGLITPLAERVSSEISEINHIVLGLVLLRKAADLEILVFELQPLLLFTLCHMFSVEECGYLEFPVSRI